MKVFPAKYKYIYQSAVVIGASLFNVAAVLPVAWASPSLPKLVAPGGPFHITVEQGTWIVLSMKLGQFIGPIPAAYMMDKFGRMRTLLFVTAPLITGWILLALAETFEPICVFRFVGGLAVSTSYMVLPNYTAEISSAHIRGYLGIIQTVMAMLSLLFMFAVGPFISVRLMAWISIIPVGLFIVIYYWLPESPYHLIAINDRAAAEVSLQKFRCSKDVKEELEQIEGSVKESLANTGAIRELFFHPRNRRNLIIVLGMSALIELSGSQIVMHYAQTIFDSLHTGIESSILSIIFGIVQLAAAILACFLVDTIGRRPLLLISVVGSGVCTAVIGVYFVLERHIDVSGLGWLPATAIIVFRVAYTIGILALIPVLASELFPKHLKRVAFAAISMNMAWIGVPVVYLYQYVVDELGSDYAFIGFSLINFAFVPFFVILLPETKRKTLEDILDENK